MQPLKQIMMSSDSPNQPSQQQRKDKERAVALLRSIISTPARTMIYVPTFNFPNSAR